MKMLNEKEKIYNIPRAPRVRGLSAEVREKGFALFSCKNEDGPFWDKVPKGDI